MDAVIESKGLKQMNDSGALEKIIDEVIAANADNVAQFRAGKDKAFNALVGQIMKASNGKVNPMHVYDLLSAKRAGRRRPRGCNTNNKGPRGPLLFGSSGKRRR